MSPPHLQTTRMGTLCWELWTTRFCLHMPLPCSLGTYTHTHTHTHSHTHMHTHTHTCTFTHITYTHTHSSCMREYAHKHKCMHIQQLQILPSSHFPPSLSLPLSPSLSLPLSPSLHPPSHPLLRSGVIADRMSLRYFLTIGMLGRLWLNYLSAQSCPHLLMHQLYMWHCSCSQLEKDT